MKFRKSTMALSISQALLGGAFAVGGMLQAAPAVAQSAQTTADDSAVGVVTVTAQSRSQQSQRSADRDANPHRRSNMQ